MIDSIDKLLELDEGREPLPYQDSRGIWTIGIGHNLEANGMPGGVCEYIHALTPYSKDLLDLLRAHSGLTDREMLFLLHYDLFAVTGFLSNYSWWIDVDDVRQAVLQDMAFNLGRSTFQTFNTFLKYCSELNWAQAAKDLRTTLVYRQLSLRYERLATMLETGSWPS